MRRTGVGIQGMRVEMRGIGGGMWRGTKIKGKERIYENILLTLWYEK